MSHKLRRALQMGSLTMAVLSAVSYWVVTTPTSPGAAGTLDIARGSTKKFNLLIAGRDIEYCKAGYGPGKLKAIPCTGEKRLSNRTDTIFLISVDLREQKMRLVSIPRDTLILSDDVVYKVNESIAHGGVAKLVSNVETLTAQNIELHAIVTIPFVERAIDGFGGLEVDVPERMVYDDFAANLHVDIPAGRSVLSGHDAIGYLRIRKGYGDDFGRMDRTKKAVSQLTRKAKEVKNVFTLLPQLFFRSKDDIETNVDLNLVLEVARNLKVKSVQSNTLYVRDPNPREWARYSYLGQFLVFEEERNKNLFAAPGLAIANDASAGQVKAFNDERLRIVIENGSGVSGLAKKLSEHLSRYGLEVTELTTSPALTTQSRIEYNRFTIAPEVLDPLAEITQLDVFAPYGGITGDAKILLGTDVKERWASLIHELQVQR